MSQHYPGNTGPHICQCLAPTPDTHRSPLTLSDIWEPEVGRAPGPVSLRWEMRVTDQDSSAPLFLSWQLDNPARVDITHLYLYITIWFIVRTVLCRSSSSFFSDGDLWNVGKLDSQRNNTAATIYILLICLLELREQTQKLNLFLLFFCCFK